MTDVYDSAKRSEVMRSVRGRDTAPELRVRRIVHRLGYRFRLYRSDLPGTPDIVLPRHKLAVFVDGCFWHGHPCCRHAARPTSNVVFWTKKLDRNVERDAANAAALRQQGWRVLTLWQCQITTDARAEALLRELLAPADGRTLGEFAQVYDVAVEPS